MAAADLTIDQQRLQAVQFTTAYNYVTVDLLLKEDLVSYKGPDLAHFLSPLGPKLWIGCLISIVFIAVALFIISYLSPYGREQNGTESKFGLLECLWFSLACILQQGPDHLPMSFSARVLVSFFWFYVLVCLATYTANFTAFFTTQQKPTITGIQDAYDNGFSFAFVNNSYLYSVFRDSNFESHNKIWKRGIFLSSAVEGMKVVRKKKCVHMCEGPILNFEANKKPCDLTVVPGLSSPRELAFALRPGDQRTALISLYMLSLRENGFIKSMQRKWWEGYNECLGTTGFVQRPVTLEKMLGMFLVLIVGAVISFIVLVIEILWEKKQKSRTQEITRKNQESK